MASSFHSRIADAVHEAKGTLSHTEAIVGRFAAWYTPTVLLLAAALGAYKGFDQFLVVIVAGCPCALLGAAPFVHGATLSLLASEHRLLIKHTNALESLARLTAFGFDKTGTLTTVRRLASNRFLVACNAPPPVSVLLPAPAPA